MTVRRLMIGMCLLLLVMLVPGCDSSSGGSGASANPCGALQSSLLECGLLTEGHFSCMADSCETQCSLGLACGDLTAIHCGDSSLSSSYEACYDDCTNFTCKDGATIASWEECDGYEDCSDGSDESGCPTVSDDPEFQCDQSPPSGTGGVTSGSSCSAAKSKLKGCGLLATGGSFDCDEPDSPRAKCYAGCAVAGQCSDLYLMVCDSNQGETPSVSFLECFSGCEELSDATADAFTCADGSGSVDEEWVCDGFDDCDDGSDESACASMVCI